MEEAFIGALGGQQGGVDECRDQISWKSTHSLSTHLLPILSFFHLLEASCYHPENRVKFGKSIFSKINIFCCKNVDFTKHQYRVKIRLKGQMLISLNISLEFKSALRTIDFTELYSNFMNHPFF